MVAMYNEKYKVSKFRIQHQSRFQNTENWLTKTEAAENTVTGAKDWEIKAHFSVWDAKWDGRSGQRRSNNAEYKIINIP